MLPAEGSIVRDQRASWLRGDELHGDDTQGTGQEHASYSPESGQQGATHGFNLTEATEPKADPGPSIISATVTVSVRRQQSSRGGG